MTPLSATSPAFPRHFRSTAVALALAISALTQAQARAHAQNPKALVAAAVQTELTADRNDHAAFIYRDHDVTPDHDTLFYVVETPQGSLKRKLADHGRPLTAEERRVDDLRIHALLSDTGAQQKQKRDSAHDDEQAEQMLKLLPTAFLWTITKENPENITLAFKPDPAFDAQNMEARVLSAMAGQITVAREQNRIRSIKGSLVDDVKIGFGILGRLKQGGTFQVERREVVPHHWQVTESHVHIAGHALFFKTIGSQEDETRSEFKLSESPNLKAAYDVLEPNPVYQCCAVKPPTTR